MNRHYWLGAAAGVLLINIGCGTLCKHHKTPPCSTCPPGKAIFIPPPPPTVPGPLVPAGATFGPPGGSFPTAPPPGAAAFNRPVAPFPTAPGGPPNGSFPTAPGGPPSGSFPTAPGGPPNGSFPTAPSITPMAPKEAPPRVESKWQPGENPDVKPRVQLYAPEAVEKEKPKISENVAPDKKPSGTFPAIPQFAEVKTNVYTGLRPGNQGLEWLQSNRVGTVVNIRTPGDDDEAEKKETEARGMRYVAVEVSPQNLSKEGVDGFIKLVRESADKGVFVYDKDGSLAAPIWYLYLRWGEFLDDDAAQLRARSLGLQNNRDGAQREMWLAVQKLLSENNR
jgi:protein tyrosine phosphatase (PTP) superfamily phosphohydrolase (DUF442 family)